MKNGSKHTFTWLKLFAPAFALELLVLWIISNVGAEHIGLGPLVVGIALGLSIAGLTIGLAINVLSKFKLPVTSYVAGHLLALILSVTGAYLYFNGQNEIGGDQGSVRLPVYHDTTAMITGNDKHAIEEVLFLMEQQYPFGAYGLTDIITEYKDLDSTTVYCTIVFTLKDEGDKKYISQYLVKNGSVQAVYTKQDTTSGEYKAYQLKSTAR